MYYTKHFDRINKNKDGENDSLILGISPIAQLIDEKEVVRILGPEYLEIIKRKNKKRQKEYFTTRRMIKELIGGNPTIRIENGILGNPVILGDSMNRQISISHSRNYAAVLIGARDMTVGVDIEDITGKDREEINVALSEDEHLFEPEFADQECFKVTLWTAKEALSKFLRIGMTADWRIFEIANVVNDQIRHEICFKFFPDIKAYSVQIKGAVYSIVCPGVEIK